MKPFNYHLLKWKFFYFAWFIFLFESDVMFLAKEWCVIRTHNFMTEKLSCDVEDVFCDWEQELVTVQADYK